MNTHQEAHPTGRRARRARRAIGARALTLNLVAMIDVVFLLLIYFMLVMNFTEPERSIDMEIAEATPQATQTDPFALPDQPIMIFVRSTGDGPGEYRLSTDSPALGPLGSSDELAAALTIARTTILEHGQRFVVTPETSTRWEHAVDVVSAVRRGGFTRVRMAEPGSST